MTKISVGLGQATLLSQMSFNKRLEFIADGLPVIFTSARGFLDAASKLEDDSRESEVLRNYAEEESAKVLILMDMVRCPPKFVAARIGTMTKWFYSHLTRLIYAEACFWKAVTVAQLQEYTVSSRTSHYLEGDYGEYIFPNQHIYNRESKLYADVVAEEDGNPYWNAPSGSRFGWGSMKPAAYNVSEALAALGAFSVAGLKIVSEVWGKLDFVPHVGWDESNRLIKEMIGKLIDAELPDENAEQRHVDTLYNSWQLPMYNLDLSLIEISLEQLNQERESIFPGY